MTKESTLGGVADIQVVQPDRSAADMRTKRVVQFAFSLWVLPRLIRYEVARRLVGDRAFLSASESIARLGGSWGVYCRQAFYRRTLASCGQDG